MYNVLYTKHHARTRRRTIIATIKKASVRHRRILPEPDPW